MVKTSDDYEKPKAIRIPADEEWLPFGDATKAQHPTGRSPRTAVIREFIRWYMHRPGAKLPKRPDPGPWSAPPLSAAEQLAARIAALSPLGAKALAQFAEYEQANDAQRPTLAAIREAGDEDWPRQAIKAAMEFDPPLIIPSDFDDAMAQYPPTG